jgi:HSP20 family protein
VSIARWDPFEEMGVLRRAMDRVIADMLGGSWRRRDLELQQWEPAVEMYETNDDVVVRAEVPNIDPKDLEISVVGDVLAIKGSTKREEEKKERSYYLRELRYGAFARMLPLPVEVRGEDAKATYKDGVLEIRIPKSERVRPRRVEVQVK